MEIKVGDYVRTKDGIIAKIEYINYEECGKEIELDICQFDRPIYYDYGEGYYNIYNEYELKKYILKYSPNIIDLIEVGDYVNGYKVLDTIEDMQTGEIHLEMPMNYTNEELGDCTIYNKDIKSIVTHEQFSSLEYII